MHRTTRISVSAFGALVALAGLEHGIGEALQGNRAPASWLILSWPGQGPFHALGGEPAMTLIPNLLITGILASLVSLAFLAWATFFVERKHAGPILALLCLAMLLMGGGFGPPLFGVILAVVAVRINNAPLSRWAGLSGGAWRLPALLWPWVLGAGLLNWLLVFPGLPLLNYLFGVDDANLVMILLTGMFGFFFLTILTALARDRAQAAQSVASAHKIALTSHSCNC